VIRVSFDAQLGDCNNNNEKNLMCYVFFFCSFLKKIKLIHKTLLIQTTSSLNLILKYLLINFTRSNISLKSYIKTT
jgi:hypothetical protein